MAVNRGLLPGRLHLVGEALAIGGTGGPRGGLPGWLVTVGSTGGVVTEPSIGSVSACLHDQSVQITGSNFGAVEGTVTIAGISQPIDSWSDTSVSFTCDRGTLRYGTYILYLYTDSAEVATTSVNLDHTYTGDWVDLEDPLAPADQRLTATPDLEAGDQVAWGGITPSGNVEVRVDGTILADEVVDSFWVEVNDGTGWSTKATQDLVPPASIGIVNFRIGGSWAGLDHPEVKQKGVWRTPYAGYIKKSGTWRKFYPETDVAPFLSFFKPGTGDYVSGLTTLQAKALDDIGLVSVSFLRGGDILLGTVTQHTDNVYTLPFDFSTLTNGAYTLYCRALDSSGTTTTSPNVSVTVDNNLPPSVTITYPPNGAEFTGDFSVAVSATDPNPTGSIANVKLYQDGSLVSTKTTAPYNWAIDTSAMSTERYVYTATAEDNLGAVSTSLPINVDLIKYTAPVLSNATVYGPFGTVGNYYALWNVTVVGNSTLRGVLTTTSATPSVTQILNGLDASGNPAVQVNSTPVLGSSTVTWQTNGLSDNTRYYVFWCAINPQDQTSNIVSASVFVPISFTVSVSPTVVSGVNQVTSTTATSGLVEVTTSPVTLTVTGATGGYTVTAEWLSGTSATMQEVLGKYVFKRTALASEGVPTVLSGTCRIQVRDATNAVIYTQPISVTTTHNWIFIDV